MFLVFFNFFWLLYKNFIIFAQYFKEKKALWLFFLLV